MRGREAASEVIAPLPIGTRNVGLHAAGCARAFRLDTDRALFDYLERQNATRCEPPLGRAEVQGIAASVWEWSLREAHDDKARARVSDYEACPMAMRTLVKAQMSGRQHAHLAKGPEAIVGALVKIYAGQPWAIFPLANCFIRDITGAKSRNTHKRMLDQLEAAGIIRLAPSALTGRKKKWDHAAGIGRLWQFTAEARTAIYGVPGPRLATVADDDTPDAGEPCAVAVKAKADLQASRFQFGEREREAHFAKRVRDEARVTILAALGDDKVEAMREAGHDLSGAFPLNRALWKAADLSPAVFGLTATGKVRARRAPPEGPGRAVA